MDKEETLLSGLSHQDLDEIKKVTSTLVSNMKIPYMMMYDPTVVQDSFSISDLTNKFGELFNEAATIISNERKTSATENETEMLAEEAEDYGISILEDFDKHELKELGSDVYQKVSDKVYDHILEHIQEEYDFSRDCWDMMYEALADIVYEKINFSKIWEVIDDILEAPVTMEEKLTDVGMSMKDFL